jgi:diaminopimelate decarboxylase
MCKLIEKISKIYGTPFYLYDLDFLKKNIESAYKEASKYSYKIHYSLKANNEKIILKFMKKKGFGVDCVSGNEIKLAIKTGFKPEEIVFAGVGKSDKELRYAINLGIFSINVESLQELELVNELSGKLGKKQKVALRINPAINVDTHQYLTTGTFDNKFGIPLTELKKIFSRVSEYKNINICGLHFHIGSQITNLEVFERLCKSANYFNKLFKEKNFAIKYLNMGGGLGIDYSNPKQNKTAAFADYFRIFKKNLVLYSGQQVHFELGRSLVAQSGMLVTKVLYRKETNKKKFVVVDAGMTDLIRPALYNSHHYIENLSSNEEKERFEIVGPVCESSDFFAKDILLEKPKRNDLLLIYSVGAYGRVMASNYNMRHKAKSYYLYRKKLFIEQNKKTNRHSKNVKYDKNQLFSA